VHQDWARALERMTSALPADARVERVIVHGGGDDMPPLKGTTLVPWSRAAEFATRVFAEGSGKLPATKPAKAAAASRKTATKGSRGTKQPPVKRKTAAGEAAAKRSVKKKDRRA